MLYLIATVVLLIRPDRPLRAGMSIATTTRAPAPARSASRLAGRGDRDPRRARGAAAVVDPYQTMLLTYGLVLAIAALGFNLLLGYTGLLSFGHSAYFGTGAYTVAFMVRYLGVQSMELCILGGLRGTLLVSALFGFVCVRHTRIFFGILTLALSQVLWSLAFKFFWVTGGTDGLRVAPASSRCSAASSTSHGPGAFQRFVFAVLLLRAGTVRVCDGRHVGDRAFAVRQGAAGDPRQRDARRVRRHPVRRYRWIAFVISGAVHRARRHPLGAAQRADDARYPLLAVLRRDRVHDACWAVSAPSRADRRRGGVQLSQDLCGREHGILAAAARRGARGPGPGPAVRIVGTRRCGLSPVYEGTLMSLLETVHLKKYFGDTHAVDDVNSDHRGGRVLSLVGPNGAGKTSFCNLVSAYYSADSRQHHLRGQDVTRRLGDRARQAGIARSFQLVNLFDDLTAFDNVALAIFSREGKTRNMAALARRDSAVTRRGRRGARPFGLAGNATSSPRPRAGRAQAARRRTRLCAAAEAPVPRRADQRRQHAGQGPIMDTIASVVRGEGITAVVIEHDMDVVFRYSDRIVVMHQGAILADGTPDEIRANEQVAMTLIGSAGPDAFARKE